APPADTGAQSAAAPEPSSPPSAKEAAAQPPANKGPFAKGKERDKPKDKDKAKDKDKDKAKAPEKVAEKVDKPPDAPPPSAGGAQFSRSAAQSALGAAAGAARGCAKPDGPTGSGRVKVTFNPSGNVTSATVQGPPFAGTAVGGCVASAFRGARVPPFEGSPVSVTKSFNIN